MASLTEARMFTAAMQLGVDYLSRFGPKWPLFAVLQEDRVFIDVLKSPHEVRVGSYDIQIDFPTNDLLISYKGIEVNFVGDYWKVCSDITVRMSPCEGCSPASRMRFSVVFEVFDGLSAATLIALTGQSGQ